MLRLTGWFRALVAGWLLMSVGCSSGTTAQSLADVVEASGDTEAPSTDDGSAASDEGPAAPGAPVVTAVEPRAVSVLGGTLVRLTGTGFGSEPVLRLGGLAIVPETASDDELTFVAPVLPLGWAALELEVAGWTVRLADAIEVKPLATQFATAPESASDAPEASEIRDAAAFDVDRDDDLDLVLATDDGLRVLQNDGTGQFTLMRAFGEDKDNPGPARPGGPFDARSLIVADATGDGDPELFVCTGAGRDVFVQASTAGLVGGPPLPVRGGACLSGAAIAANRDGHVDLVWLVETESDPALMVLLGDGVGGFTWSEFISPSAPDTHPIGETTTEPAGEGTTTFTRVTGEAASGIASGKLTFSLGAGTRARFSLDLSIDGLQTVSLQAKASAALPFRVELTDAAGATWLSPELNAQPYWAPVTTPISAWAADATLPFTSLALVIDGPNAGTLHIDDIGLGADQALAVLQDFEERTYRHHFPGGYGLVAGDLDGDALDDLLLITEPGARLIRTAPAALGAEPDPIWVSSPVSLAFSAEGPWVAACMPDAQSDGDLDPVLISAGGQDRLLMGDGWGQLLDATTGGMPVDWVSGRTVATADVDLDGHADLVIGNADATDRLYRGTSAGRFEDVTPHLGFDTQDTGAVVIADFDGDGAPDIAQIPHSGALPPLLRFGSGEVAP